MAEMAKAAEAASPLPPRGSLLILERARMCHLRRLRGTPLNQCGLSRAGVRVTRERPSEPRRDEAVASTTPNRLGVDVAAWAGCAHRLGSRRVPTCFLLLVVAGQSSHCAVIKAEQVRGIGRYNPNHPLIILLRGILIT